MKNNKTHKQYCFVTVFIFLLFTFTFLLAACNTTEPPPPKKPEKPKVISLKLITKSSKEIFLTVNVKDTILPIPVIIKRDGKKIMKFYQTKGDTTVIDTGLTAGKTYTYQPIVEVNGKEEAGKAIQVTTLDTTSNNFTWQTFTFGDPRAGSSTLNDVAIINENDIWAVGEIYMNDSTGKPDPLPYNAVHWDGIKWEVKRVTTEFRGNLITVPLDGIYAFSTTDIWVVGSLPIHGDGKNWTMYDVRTTTDPNLSLSKAWGRNSKDIYFVGRSGSIAHFNGTSWQKIESGTTTNLNDIWGYYDTSNSNESIITVASNILHHGEYRLLAISGNTAHDTLNWPYNNWLKGIWFQGKYSPVYVCGSGIREYKNGKWEVLNLPAYFTESIRGTDVNDIMAVGDYGLIMHFNGVRWDVYKDFMNQALAFNSVAIKNNTVVIVGITFSGGIVGKAIIIIGRR